MALNQAQRIEISKKVIEIPQINEALGRIKTNIETEIVKLQNIDDGNKSFMDEITVHINAYQDELELLDGNNRTKLVEQDMIDSANKIKQNFFFPNDFQTPLPNVPDGIWKFFTPFGGNLAIGKNYVQAFPGAVTKEQDKIDAINTVIATIEAIIDPYRSTGLECLPGTPDTYEPHLDTQQALIDLVAAINDWKSFLLDQQAIIYTLDPDSGRQSQNDSAIQDIDDLIAAIDSYLLYDDFDTTTALPTGSAGVACALFEAMTADDFQPSKLRSYELQEIKDEITARISFISTRISQINTNLGSVGQNLSTGELTGSGTGFYDDRFKVINIRLNLLGGSLNKLLSTKRGSDAQDNIEITNNNTLDVYSGKIKVSKFRAPASNTGTIHVLNASEFSPGDSVYVVADKQTELSGIINSVTGNTIVLNINIPEKYNHMNFARVYKLL